MFEKLKAGTRSIFRAITGAGKSTILRIEEIFGGIFASTKFSQLRDYETYLGAGTHKCWALYKVCDTIAKTLQDTPFKLTRKNGNGQPVQNQQILSLLAVPNQFETWSELLTKTVFGLILTGNAFWAKDKANLSGDKPKAIYSLNPKRIQISVDPKAGIIGYIYRPEKSGVEVPYDPQEIIHFRLPHANNDYWGLGVVEAGEDLIQDSLNRQGWNSKFWENGASPSGLLICEDKITDKASFDLAKAEWKKEYSGTDNSGKTAWLTGKWSYQKLGLSSVEMQNIEGAKWSIEQIFMLGGVPLSVAGVKEAANYATASVDDLRYRRMTVKPLCTLIAESITSDLVQGFDQSLTFEFTISGLIDLGNVTQNFVPLFDRGVLSINEMRELSGLSPVENDPLYDQHFINAGLVPLALAGAADQGQTQQQARAIVDRFLSTSLFPAARNGS